MSHPSPPEVGDTFEVVVGPVAHGGHFVARHEGQVVFVRHALPGERVVCSVTETGTKFLRADAIKVLEAAPMRVRAPCPYAGPGGCGGCDFQHIDPAEQRALKALVIAEQLARLAGIEREVVVEEVPPVLGWRTRMQYVDLPTGRGLRKHRSHDVVPIERCLIAHPDAHEVLVPREERSPGRSASARPVEHPVTERVRGREFVVGPGGFWQPHVAAPEVLVDCVLDMVDTQPGEGVLDLYAGVGLFAAFLGAAVGPEGRVVAVEGDRTAAACARENLKDQPQSRVVRGRVDRVLARGTGPAQVVVLDPPRVGAKRAVVRAIAELAPRAVAYVACDPAALARDLGYFAEHDYRVADLRAFDLFPMTHHVECVALLERTRSDLG